MRKLRLKYFFGIVLVLSITSCLNIDSEPQIATAEDEKIDLERYIRNLQQKGEDIDTTDLGVYYVTIEEGEGNSPKTGDTLELGYAGYFIDGTLFDASDKYNDEGTIEFVLGDTQRIKGWNDGMKVLNKNAKVQLIIPSELAYGSKGLGTIPPYKTLVFVVKLKNIKPINSSN